MAGIVRKPPKEVARKSRQLKRYGAQMSKQPGMPRFGRSSSSSGPKFKRAK